MQSATLSAGVAPESSGSLKFPISFLAVTWILMFPLLYFASDGTFWFDAGANNNSMATAYGSLAGAGETAPDHNFILLLLVAILAAAIFPKLISVTKLLISDKVFAALVVWAATSCLWSQLPLDSLKTSIYVGLNTIFTFYLYRRFNPDQQIRLLLMLGWFCLVLSIALSLFFPRFGIDYTLVEPSWKGMYGQKNLCSMTTSFLLVSVLYVPSKNLFFNLSRIAYAILSVFLIFMTKSATGKICLACILGHFLFAKAISRLRPREKTIFITVLGVIAVTIIALSPIWVPHLALLLGKDVTLTGRTDIWQSVIATIMKHPILGYGYSAFWRGFQGASASISLANHWAVSSAHNAFLEVWLNLGVVGMVLVVFSMVRAVRDAFVCIRGDQSPYLAWCTCILLLTIATAMDEGELMVPNNLMWILYILACIGLSEGAKKIRLKRDKTVRLRQDQSVRLRLSQDVRLGLDNG